MAKSQNFMSAVNYSLLFAAVSFLIDTLGSPQVFQAEPKLLTWLTNRVGHINGATFLERSRPNFSDTANHLKGISTALFSEVQISKT
jgi:hypothetical protein